MKPTQQIYSNYTNEDKEVWSILFNRQMQKLAIHASAEFLAALERIGFHAQEIPDFTKVNAVLKKLTGWQLIVVPELCPAKEFFHFLANRQFTATCWLRKMDQLDYLEEPDMFHDVFAHAPLLSNKHYADFFADLGKLAVEYAEHAEAVEMLERLYWFTIEFGLIEENGSVKIYGSGIISSKEETLHALSDVPLKEYFNLHKIIRHEFRTDVLQNHYYIIRSFDELLNALTEMKQLLARQFSKTMA